MDKYGDLLMNRIIMEEQLALVVQVFFYILVDVYFRRNNNESWRGSQRNFEVVDQLSI